MRMSCSYFNNAFLMPAFNPEGKKFLGGEGVIGPASSKKSAQRISRRTVTRRWDKFGLLTCATDILVKIRPVLSFTVMNKFSFLVVSF